MLSRDIGADGPLLPFFDEVERAGSRVIQFKSSRNLIKSFRGETDFDLLVSPDDLERVLRITEDLGFVRRASRLDSGGTLDYLSMNWQNTKVQHLSFHPSLVFGRKLLKGRILPFRIWRSSPTVRLIGGLHIFEPEFELMILMLRMAFRLRSGTKNSFSLIDPEFIEDFHYLNQGILLPDAFRTWEDLVGSPLAANLYALARQVPESNPDSWSRSIVFHSFAIRLRTRKFKRFRLGRTFWKSLKQQYMRRQFPRRFARIPGVSVGVVGADGAGKTTLVAGLTRLLNYKLDAKRFYLGQQKSSRSQRWLLFLQKKVTRIGKSGLLVRKIRDVDCMRLRFSEFKRCRHLVKKGGLAVIDRYPLRELRGLPAGMDSPKLAGKGVLGFFEMLFADRISAYPDLLIVISAPLPSLLGRDGTNPEVRADKAAAIEQLLSGDLPVKCLVLDGTSEPNELVDAAHRFVWEETASRS